MRRSRYCELSYHHFPSFFPSPFSPVSSSHHFPSSFPSPFPLIFPHSPFSIVFLPSSHSTSSFHLSFPLPFPLTLFLQSFHSPFSLHLFLSSVPLTFLSHIFPHISPDVFPLDNWSSFFKKTIRRYFLTVLENIVFGKYRLIVFCKIRRR